MEVDGDVYPRPDDIERPGQLADESGANTPLPQPEQLLKTATPAEVSPPRRTVAGDLAVVGRFIWTHNPFYLISACLVFYGLYVAFNGSAVAENKWWLLGLMTGYTALMAATAFAIVRFGKVWDDARSILLILVLLFVGTSISLDEIGIKDVSAGIPLILTGLGCAAAISHMLIRGLQIKLPALYQLSYYLILSVLFLHPLGIMLIQEYGDAANKDLLAWSTLAFPLAQGLAFLTLLPAIRKGARHVAHNGTPWRWPGFPLAVFGLLALCVCVRQFALGLSFMPVKGMSLPFGLYCLVPFLLCLAVLLLEFSLVTQRNGARWAALLLPIATVFAAFSPDAPNATYAGVLETVTQTIGSPVFIAAMAAMAFYIYAWIRKVRYAELWLCAVIVIASFVGLKTTGFGSLTHLQPVPLLVVGVLAAWKAFRSRSSFYALVSLSSIVGALTLLFKGTVFTTVHGAIPVHLLLFGILGMGLLIRDRLAQVLSDIVMGAIAALHFLVVFRHGALAPSVSGWMVAAYTGAMTAIPFAYWGLSKRKVGLVIGILNACWSVIGLFVGTYAIVRDRKLPRGAIALFWGALSFIVALAISLIKGGIIRKPARRSPGDAGLSQKA